MFCPLCKNNLKKSIISEAQGVWKCSNKECNRSMFLLIVPPQPEPYKKIKGSRIQKTFIEEYD